MDQILFKLGNSLKSKRLHKNLSLKSVSEKANISYVTLWSIEKGVPTVAIGKYLKVVEILNMQNELFDIFKDCHEVQES